MSLLTRFLRDEDGATAIEYGLIAAGISVAIIATVAGLGTKLNSTFTSVEQRAELRLRAPGAAALANSPPPRLRPRRR